MFGKRLHQLKLGALHQRDHALGNPLVVQGVFDRVRERRLADVRSDLDVDEDGLTDLALPVVDADDRLGLSA